MPVTIFALEDSDRLNDDNAIFAFSSPGMMTLHVNVEVIDDDFQTYVVNSLADTAALDGKLTLREALTLANTNTTVFDAPLVVRVQTSLLLLRRSSPVGTRVKLGGTELTITDNLEIVGPGMETLEVSGNNRSRVFNIAPDAKCAPQRHDHQLWKSYNRGWDL